MQKYVFTDQAWEVYSRFMTDRKEWDLPSAAQAAIVTADGYYTQYGFRINLNHNCKSLIGIRKEKDGSVTRTLLWSEGHDFAKIVQLEYEGRRTSVGDFGRVFGFVGSIAIFGNLILSHPIMTMGSDAGANVILALCAIVGALTCSYGFGWLAGKAGEQMVIQPKVVNDNYSYTLGISYV